MSLNLCPKSLLVMLELSECHTRRTESKTTAIRLWIEDIVIVLQENKAAAGAFIFGVLWYLISSCVAHFQNLLITLYLLPLSSSFHSFYGFLCSFVVLWTVGIFADFLGKMVRGKESLDVLPADLQEASILLSMSSSFTNRSSNLITSI